MSSKNQDCFVAILKDRKLKIKTQEILDMTDKFPDLCSGCKSGTDVVMAGMKLVKLGIVIREIGRGGYYWSLKESE